MSDVVKKALEKFRKAEECGDADGMLEAINGDGFTQALYSKNFRDSSDTFNDVRRQYGKLFATRIG